ISSLPSSAHTYRLLIFKERFCEELRVSQQRCVSAAEKQDYEPCFAARQQLFNHFVATAGPSSCASRAPNLPHTADFASPLPRRVSVSAKEA
ncbi:hypothetical protein, partial [Burkholderia pyrrocinia]|uniref:hypothetical protein n=1 Tax=Burkholderia pyrrocinia TaxID=60550 RepID=UPI001ABB3E04